MSQFTMSGFGFDAHGQQVLVTQGSQGYTLVAQKKILFRLFTPLAAQTNVTVIATVISREIFGTRVERRTIVIPSKLLHIETSGCLGPSVGVLFAGDMFSRASPFRYSVKFVVVGHLPLQLQSFQIDELKFLKPGRLRLMIHNLAGTAPWGTRIEPDFSWLLDMFKSLERLSNMLPVRDGVKLGLTHDDAGICFIYGDTLDSWPAICPLGGEPPCSQEEMNEVALAETRAINAGDTGERIDATVRWRPRDLLKPGGAEGVGGKAFSINAPPGTGIAGVVGGNFQGKEMTGSILAQEVGHLFGLEPPDSPHFEDPLDEDHSKDPVINDHFAFDFYLLKHYSPPSGSFLGDAMNNFGGGVRQGRDMVLYNAFDWEHLRKRLAALVTSSRTGSSTRRSSRKTQEDDTLPAFGSAFSGASAIKTSNPIASLPRKTGYSWAWTAQGFQLVLRAGSKRGSVEQDPTAASIFRLLEGEGVKEFFAPVGRRSLPMVLHPSALIPFDPVESGI